MNFVILGKQGCGKGTQAGLLAKKFDLEHIDMGKSLREMASLETPLAREIYHIQNVKHTLVPRKVLKEILNVKISSLPFKKGIVFDGAPRTVDQVEYMEEILLSHGRKIDRVFYIDIPEEESIKRTSQRWNCRKCDAVLIMGRNIKKEDDKCVKCGGEIFRRPDDTPNGVKKRLEVFKKETMPVLDHFKEKGILIKIDGMMPIKKVFEEILKNIPVA